MLIGLAGSGKTFACLSIAELWQRLYPNNKVYYLDYEDKARKTWKLSYPHVSNMQLYYIGKHFDEIDGFLKVFREIASVIQKNDWLIIESDTRIWAGSQDKASISITGQGRDSYLTSRLNSENSNKMPVIPQPDKFWQIALDCYRRQYRNVLTNDLKSRTNILITTGITVAPGLITKRKKATMAYLNTAESDLIPDGHAENVRIPDTVILMEKAETLYLATILKDVGYDMPGLPKRFVVESFFSDFLQHCR